MVQLSSLSSLQAMKPGVCEEAIVGDTARLKDERDDKYYWIAKLVDGNCWMTQNLALDLSTTKALTSDLSDIPTEVGSWTPENTTQTSPSGWDTTANVTRSYNPGSYVYTTPNSQSQCANTGTGLSACTSNGWKSTSGLTPSADPNFYKNNYDQVVTNGYYDAHYLSGNYYSWAAATAGQANSLTSSTAGEQATRSICPKGWRLPIGNNSTASKTFGYLLTQYGVNSSLVKGDYDIRLVPLYFIYGGYVYSSTLNAAGSEGRYWSSTAYSGARAYYLYFTTSVNPSDNSNRYGGFSVRCVAR